MKVAFQLDDLDSLNLKSDSSLYLAYSLQIFSHEIFVYNPNTIIYGDNGLEANFKKILIEYVKEGFQYKIIKNYQGLLADFDVVIVRQNPPFNMEYITYCYLLNLLPAKCIVLNDPKSLILYSEKLSVLEFSQYIPKTMIISNIGVECQKFLKDNKKLVAKPLYGFAGEDVKLLSYEGNWKSELSEMLANHKHVILQEFLEGVISFGDKRVVIMGDEIIGSFKRIPQNGDIRANLAVGGEAYKTALTAKERSICEQLLLWLRKNNIYWAGIDLLDERLIEINITSPTGLVTLHKMEQITFDKVAKNFINHINDIS